MASRDNVVHNKRDRGLSIWADFLATKSHIGPGSERHGEWLRNGRDKQLRSTLGPRGVSGGMRGSARPGR